MDLMGNVCKQLGIDMETLYVQMASRHNDRARANIEANKQHHKHWKPPKGSGLPASDIRHMMAAKANININGVKYSIKQALTVGQPTNVSIDGIPYSMSMALTTYHVSASRRSASRSLVYRGANGGIVGDDCHLIEETTHFVNIEGIDDHVMERRPIITAGATVKSNRGPVILIMNQYAHAGKGHTIHSSPQMEYYGLSVDEKSRKVGGLQRISTTTGLCSQSTSDEGFLTLTCNLSPIRNGTNSLMSPLCMRQTGIQRSLTSNCPMIRIGSIAFLRPLSSPRCSMSKVRYARASRHSSTLCVPCP